MDFVLLHFDAVKAVAIIALVVGFVQWIKKACEWVAAHVGEYSWLRPIAEWLAHGWRPIAISAIVSIAALLPNIVADGALTLQEALTIVGVFGGANLLYRGVRRWIFPKT